MTILCWVTQHVVVTAMLVAAVALASRLLSNRPALEHALWLVVLARFMLPPLFDWPLSFPRGLAGPSSMIERSFPSADASSPLAEAIAAPETATIAESPLMVVREGASSVGATRSTATEAPQPFELDAQVTPFLPAPELPTPRRETESRAELAAGIVVEQILLAAWFVGCVFVGWRTVRQITSFSRMVGRAAPAPEYLRLEADRMAGRFGVRPIRVLVAPGISSPFVWCLGSAKMIWPASLCDPMDLGRWQGVMAHELAHVRRRDHWVAWLELVAGIAWWWNPLVWFVRRRLRRSAEAASDALAISLLPESRQAYAEAFLELAQLPRIGGPAPALGIGWRGEKSKSFQRRLAMILSERVTSGVSLPGLAAVAVLAIVALPGWSLGEAEPPAGDGTSEISAETAAPEVEDDPSAGLEEGSAPQSHKAEDKPTPAPSKDGAESLPDLTLTMFMNAETELAWPSEKIARASQQPRRAFDDAAVGARDPVTRQEKRDRDDYVAERRETVCDASGHRARWETRRRF